MFQFDTISNTAPEINWSYRTMTGEDVFKLCAGDTIVTYITGSKNPNTIGTTSKGVEVKAGIRGEEGNNKLVITKVWFS